MRAFFALVLITGLATAQEAQKPVWMAVGPPALLKALGPLADHRREEGFDVRLVPATNVADALAKAPQPPAYLLLVGDAGEGEAADAWRLPPKTMELYRWRAVQKKTYASDAAWGDRDGDGLPDLPVGRIPAHTPAQVQAVVKKTLAWEQRTFGPGDLRLVAWAGAPGYGGAVDTMATTMLVNTLREHAPRWAAEWLISADSIQPLCGWPPDQPALFAAAMRQGSLLNAACAHGNSQAIFSMRHGDGAVWFGRHEASVLLPGDAPTAPLLLLACNCGEFDGPQEAFAEMLLLLPGGPVATIGASTESHPLTNYYTGVAILDGMGGKDEGEPRLGSLWFHAQQQAAKAANLLIESFLKDVEGKLEPEIDTQALRRDQQRMYVLFGDPALRLPLPGALEATVKKDGDGWAFEAQPVAGATRLYVGLRPPSPAPAMVGKDANADTRRRLFAEANAAAEFAPLLEIAGDQPWRGRVAERGTLRLVAAGPGWLRVAAIELR